MHKLIPAALTFIFALSFTALGQKIPSKAPEPLPAAITSSPAYAETVLRKTELTADLESLLVDYTDEYPKVKELKFTLGVLQKEMDRMANVKTADAGRLTLALGRLMVKKADLETDLWKLLQTYKEEHPDVKRAKKKVDIYESAIKSILG